LRRHDESPAGEVVLAVRRTSCVAPARQSVTSRAGRHPGNLQRNSQVFSRNSPFANGHRAHTHRTGRQAKLPANSPALVTERFSFLQTRLVDAMLPLFSRNTSIMTQPASVPLKAWVVTFAGTAVNLCLGILYAWSVWKANLVADAIHPAGSPMLGLNEGWSYLTDAQATWAYALCGFVF